MNRNIKATYDGKYFELTAEECNTVELLSFVCDVVEQALHVVAVPSIQIQEVEELSETSRGVGGFGSTGK